MSATAAQSTAAQGTRALRVRRVAIIGAGFAGLGMAIRLKQAGIEDFVVLERADEIGGTWRENVYPGCQCDVPSHLYSFSFAPKPDWSRTYSRQGEILDYLRDCARRFEITPHIRLAHDVERADWDEQEVCWRLQTSGGEIAARILVAGAGPLSEPRWPEIPGLDRFRGARFHSAAWDGGHDLRGERVAVIGTGASAIQVVPEIAPQVDELKVFQRTPPWVVPHSDRATSARERAIYRRVPALQRAVRAGIYCTREALVLGLAVAPPLMGVVERLAERQLAHQVPDRRLRADLRPDYAIGCKRIVPSNRWYPALMRDNVEVIGAPITEVGEDAVVTGDGSVHEVDTIIACTGFGVTDMRFAHRLRGRDGVLLADAWAGGAQAYLGTTVPGFPNLFLMIGPNTGLGHSSMVFMIESQLRYVIDCLRTMDGLGAGAVEVRESALLDYNRRLQRRLARTVWNQGGCSSWYLDAHGRNTTLWPRFSFDFRRRTARFDRAAYDLR